MSKEKIKIGVKCKWLDPCINEYENQDEALERIFTIKMINGDENGEYENDDDIILISDGVSEIEVYAKEIIIL